MGAEGETTSVYLFNRNQSNKDEWRRDTKRILFYSDIYGGTNSDNSAYLSVFKTRA